MFTYVNCLEPPCGQHSEGSVLARLEGYDEAIRLDPRVAVAYYNRGIVYAELGLTQKAIMDFGEAIRLNPQFAPAYNQRAVVRSRLGELETAIDDLDEAVRLDPKVFQGLRKPGSTVR